MPEPYKRANYTLYRYELVAPHVNNSGEESRYQFAVRGGLVEAGFTGWTEINSCGFWLGKLEAGTTFVIYAGEFAPQPGKAGRAVKTERALARIGRACMPDQEAIQIVKFPHPVELIEA